MKYNLASITWDDKEIADGSKNTIEFSKTQLKVSEN